MQIDTFGRSRCHQSLWLSDTHHFTSTSCKRWLSNYAMFSLNDVKLSCSAHLSLLWSLLGVQEWCSFHQISAWCLSDGIPICQTFFSLNTYVILSYFSLLLTSGWRDWLCLIFSKVRTLFLYILRTLIEMLFLGSLANLVKSQ